MEPTSRQILPEELLKQMGWVLSLARSLVRDPTLADDVAQDAWLQAVERPPARAVSGPGMRAWLASVTRNLARQSGRSQVSRRRREHAAARPDAQLSTAEIVERGALHQRLVDAVMGLDEPYRSTILLRFLDGLSAAEIAERMEVSAAGVRQRLSRGLEQLRGRLDREFGEDRSAWASLLFRLSERSGTPSRALPTPELGTAGGLAMAKGSLAAGALKFLGAIGIGTALVLGAVFVVEKTTNIGPGAATSHSAGLAPLIGQEAHLSRPGDSARDARQALPTAAKSNPSSPGGPESSAGSMDATLIVRVVAKETGSPLSGIRVSLSPSKSGGSFVSSYVDRAKGTMGDALRSNAEGAVEFTLSSPNSLRLTASGEDETVGGAALEIAGLSNRERRTLSVELPTRDDLDFHGQVLSREDQHPVAGARVRLVRFRWLGNEGWSDLPFAQSVSDAEGRFEFLTATWKDPHIRVEADGFASAIVSPGAGHETWELAFSVRLDRAATVVAHVVDSGETGIAGAQVLLKTWANRVMQPRESSFLSDLGFPDPEWSATTASDGSCRLEGLVPGAPIEVEIRTASREPLKIEPPLILKPGEVRETHWCIEAGCSLTGTVFDQHNMPVAKLELWLERARKDKARFLEVFDEVRGVIKTTTDDTGHYSFSNVASGTWWIGAAPMRYGPKAVDPNLVAPMSSVVAIQPDVRTNSFDLHVQRGFYICGQVFDPSGIPVTAAVSASQSRAFTGLNSQTGADGRFVLGPLVPGQYDLFAMGLENTSRSEPVPASAGDDNVILRLPPGGVVSGRVVILETQEPCQAVVIVAARDLDDPGILTGGTAGDGAFHFGGLKPGLYDVTAKTRGGLVGVARAVSIVGGSETKDLVVRVEPGGRIRVRYEGSASRSFFRVVHDKSAVAGGTIEGRDSAVKMVPSGKVTVSLRFNAQEKLREKVVEIQVGEEKEIVFRDGD